MQVVEGAMPDAVYALSVVGVDRAVGLAELFEDVAVYEDYGFEVVYGSKLTSGPSFERASETDQDK